MPLTKDMISDKERWALSLLLTKQTLHVKAVRAIGTPAAICESLPLSAAAEIPNSAFQEIIYENPLLLGNFRSTTILVDTEEYFVAPSESVSDDASLAAAVKQMGLDDADQVTLTAELDDFNTLCFNVDKNTYRFISRTFPTAALSHPIASLARHFRQKARQGNAAKVFVDLNAHNFHVLTYDRMGLVSAGSFEATAAADITYYTLMSAQAANIDPTRDQFILSGPNDLRSMLTPALRPFAAFVLPALVPSAVAEILPNCNLPFSLQICE